MSQVPPWRVGWSEDGRRFYFRAPNGYRVMLTGPKVNVQAHLKRLLPEFLTVARARGDYDPEFVAAIEREVAALGEPA